MTKELYLVESDLYNQNIVEIVTKITKAKAKSKVCYVTLNKTYRAMIDFLSKEKIKVDNFYFIDLITPTIFITEVSDKVTFLDSLDDLNVFAEKILNLVKVHKIEKVIFDSISSFLVYRQPKDVLTFFDYIISFFEKLNVDIAIIALKEDENKPAIKQIKMRVDNTGTIGE